MITSHTDELQNSETSILFVIKSDNFRQFRSKFQKTDDESVDEYTKNSSEVLFFKSKKPSGTWINCKL